MATVNESMAQLTNGSALGAAKARRDFSTIQSAIAIPSLLAMQQESYKRFLQMDLLPDERVEDGLQAVFKSVFPISDFREMSRLDFVSYSIGDWACKCGSQIGLNHLRVRCRHCRAGIRTDPKGPPEILCEPCGKRTPNEVTFCEKCGDPVGLKLKYDPEECKRRGLTYSAPLKVSIRLTVFEKDGAGDQKTIRDIKEQEVFFGEIPLMTEEGTFIITGTERVIVSQLHRSPGVFFESSADNTYYLGKIIPSRGSWIEFEYDTKKPAGQRLLHVRIDRKRKFLGTVFLRALGLESDADILGRFYRTDAISLDEAGELRREISESLLHTRLGAAVTGRSGKALGRKGRKISARLLQDMRADGVTTLPCSTEDLAEAVFADDLFDEESGEVLKDCEANAPVTEDCMARIREKGIREFKVVFPESDECGPMLSETLRKDSVKSKEQALLAIYRNLRPGDPPTRETATKLFNEMFFDARKYDFSRVGRMKFNIKLHGEEEATPLERRVLDASDFYATIGYLFKLRRKIGATDDIDHLGNRRVRSVGELLENQFRIGLIRMERAMRDRMTSHQDMSSAMPNDLINAKPVMAAVREFFGSSQLSQFMDQINPLSEITHKRRLSSLGPGGLSRERAGFDVRDVHATHYGRICPVETAEGANIGLISSLSCFARINQYGFIESPYRKVESGRVVDEVRITYAGDTPLKRGQIVTLAEAERANAELGDKVKITSAGDTPLKRGQIVTLAEAERANAELGDKVKITSAGDTPLKRGQIVTLAEAERANAELGDKVKITSAGDTPLKRGQIVTLAEAERANAELGDKVKITSAGDSEMQLGQVVTSSEVEAINQELRGKVCILRDSSTALQPGQIVPRVDAEQAFKSSPPNLQVHRSFSGHAADETLETVELREDVDSFFRASNLVKAETIGVQWSDPTHTTWTADALEDASWTADALASFETHCDYLSAWEEDRLIIAQANIPVDENGYIGREFANCRVAGDTRLKRREEIQYLDVSPKQLVSVAASLIPFLENDDANRALMGSNMQRQAVPLLRAESPIVGTGMERITAQDSGAVVLCKRSGVVDSVDAERIIVRVEDTGHEEQLSREVGADIYPLVKFRRSNQNTCINQKPIVKIGERVGKGQVLADGPCTDAGELALGRNVLVAFMPWRGYNFEDAILVSEKLVKEDYYTSLHIEELKIEARDTKLGPEEITRDIPNIAESFLGNLDESGIIRTGATINPGDILVGKVVPRGDVQLTPEEKLLRAIFGDKADDVKDASLRCPAGVAGVVVGAKVFSRKGVEKDSRAKAIEEEEIRSLERNLEDEKRILYDQRVERLEELLGGKTVTADLHDEKTNKRLAAAGEVLGREHFERMRARDLKRLRLEEQVEDLDDRVESLEQMTIRQIEVLEKLNKEKVDKLRQGDELAPGVLKAVTISVAMKRKLSAGDKMAGRHGNKGVIARVMPEEDMPFLPDGTPVEIVLNPLGVPSRMNVGQVLETHLGWAGRALGLKFAAPVFEGPGEERIKQHLREAGLPESGKTCLFDGLTGQAFEQEVTVGIIYMLKLNHLVDDKIHARSIGPYSLVTQQPLGGKAQFGGQRFGEMEVWALEAYGAAHILRELLTVKSDDVAGRSKIYESIVKGESVMNPGLPESFNVLVRELQALCLDVELIDKQNSSDRGASLGLFDPSVAPAPLPAGDLNPALGGFAEQNPFAAAAAQRVTAMPDFDAVKIGLASPEKIRGWSYGEVTKPETINYRTFKPERGGLFCTAIFGPEKDWECLCGKYKRMKYRGVICEKCGTEVTHSRVRRERLGHIELAAPCSHVWYFKVLPSHLSLLLDIKVGDLERVLYYEASVVVESDDPDMLATGTVLAGDDLSNSRDENERQFDFAPLAGHGRYEVLPRSAAGAGSFQVTVLMGAEAIQELLRRISPEELAGQLREEMKSETSVQKRRKTAQRLRVAESFRKSGNKPEWMILQVLPIIPPELRPLVPLDGGRFATSDLNDLYRRVINRNNRLKRLLEQRAPDVIVRNEKRMLQEAVDALLDNGRRGHELRGANKRPLKSLANTLKGKSGRFRQNLLGKRVDYSGRSVIVVGPELKLHQCGLPKKMALELYKPFIYQRLEQRGHCTTVKQAKELVEQKDAIVWDILDGVIQDHPVLLNRAPTLHRLGIQAFEPVLVEGKSIKIHPLVCTAFNADFDGDQMGVHVPLSPEAQIEAHVLMLSANNILSPASGLPITTPSQDMVLGVYYLTGAQEGARGAGRSFGSIRDVLLAYDLDEVETRTPIKLHYSGPVIDLTLASDNQKVGQTVPVFYHRQILETTVGRVLLNDCLPAEMPFVNGLLKKRGLSDLVRFGYQQLGREKTVEMLDELKDLGFLYATLSGMSIGIADMIVPEQKEKLVSNSQKEVMTVEQQYLDGAITHGERYNKIIEIWSSLTDSVSSEMLKGMSSSERTRSELNPIYAMADSGARGSETQIRQLSGMRGLMAKPSGEIIETPITANFREGLNVLQYFISTHGARKGLADTALKTANSGYLTRRLVDVAQDVIITEHDCCTPDGIDKGPLMENGGIRVSLSKRIIGRVMAEDALDLEGELIISAGEEVTDAIAQAIESANIHQEVKVRSVLTCETERGVCRLCYGQDLATGRMVEEGQAVGIIAAQSIGEPGTQLTMRTFHVGGTATRVGEDTRQTAKSVGFAKYENVNPVRDKSGHLVAMGRNGFITVVDGKGRERERYQVVYAARLRVEDGAEVAPQQVLLEWDPFTRSILTESEGHCRFRDLQEGVTLQEQVDEISGLSQWVVSDPEDGSKAGEPRIEILDGDGKLLRRYLIPTTAHLMVKDDEAVSAGDELAKIPLATTRNKDITGGLPRVVELFEARRPKSPEPAIISEIDGTVSYGKLSRGYRLITVSGAGGAEKEYKIPRGSHINVQEGEFVKAGEALMEGPRDPQDILQIQGEAALQSYLVNEIQDVYRLQGVEINDKHLEVIVRQMMRWVQIESVGDTEFLVDEVVDKFRFRRINREVEAGGGVPATSQPLLMGIRKAAVSTDSFISAASFETTTKVLTEAAVAGRVDDLRGLKENVIVGRLIPAGTGLKTHQRVRIAGEDEPEKLVPEVEYLNDIPGYSEDAAQLFEGDLPMGFGEGFDLDSINLPSTSRTDSGETDSAAPTDPVIPD